MSNNRILGYSSGKQGSPPRKIVSADIETDGLGGAFLMGAWQPEDGPIRYFREPSEMIRQFITHKYYGWEMLFHNADYDMRYLLPTLEALTYEGYETQLCCDGTGRIIHVTISKHRQSWHIRDTYTLIPIPLSQLATFAGMEKHDIGLRQGVVFDPNDPDHLAYLERDIVLLLRAYKRVIKDLLNTFNVKPSYSIGSTAVRVFRSTIPQGHIWYRQRPEVEEIGRAAYFGGLVFVRTVREQYNVTKIDVNGMYAAAMRQGVPTGSGAYTTREIPNRPGIYNCHVYASSKIRFSFIPVREGKRTSYPHNHFDATLTSHTIAYARRMGYEIEVIDGYVFQRIEYLFDPFVQMCQELEDRYKTEGVGKIAKLLRNSLAGKLGQRKEGREYYLTSEGKYPMTPIVTLQGVVLKNLWYIETETEAAHMMPVWAAWITASARIMLSETVYAIGPGWCIYGDTDSLVVDNLALAQAVDLGAVSIGAEYGKWKVERKYEIWRAGAPKMYVGAYRDPEGNLVLDGAHKGIPDRAISLVELRAIYNEYDVFVEYDQIRRAINTTGGRPFKDSVHKTIKGRARLQYNIDPFTGEILAIVSPP